MCRLTSALFAVANGGDEARMHGADGVEQSLHTGIDGNTTTSLRVTSHPVHEDLYTTG